MAFGWSDKTIDGLVPLAGEPGRVGIQTKQKYLMHQVRGTKSFLMTWVEGRTIPLGGRRGMSAHFRRGSHVGEPGYVNIPGVGRVYREQRWRHPGIKPNRFMEDAITAAVKESQPLIRAEAREVLRGRGGGRR